MKIKGFKGFNLKLQCTPKDKVFQYEVGKTYEEDEAELCKCGFHFCKDPLDCFKYYSPDSSRYCVIEADDVSTETKDDSKRTCKRLSVKKEIGLQDLIQAGVEFKFDKANWSKAEKFATGDRGVALSTEVLCAASVIGDRGVASATGGCGVASITGDHGVTSSTGMCGVASVTGDYGVASSTGMRGVAPVTGNHGVALATEWSGVASVIGDHGVALATGMRGVASVTGDYGVASATGGCGVASVAGHHGAASVDGAGSVATSLGGRGKTKGVIGSWLILAEWAFEEKWVRKDVQCRLVDGEQIKADTWYKLKDGMFVEVDE